MFLQPAKIDLLVISPPPERSPAGCDHIRSPNGVKRHNSRTITDIIIYCYVMLPLIQQVLIITVQGHTWEHMHSQAHRSRCRLGETGPARERQDQRISL